MTNEELDEARGVEAYRLWESAESRVGETTRAVIAARLARENWTPPEPVVDPDLVAFEEWWRTEDGSPNARVAYLAGARMATEREQERANLVVAFAVRVKVGAFYDLDHAKREARKAINEYGGEA